MKKYIIPLIIFLILIGMGIMGFCLFNRIFPKAEPIKYPQVTDIITVNTHTYFSNHKKNQSVTIPKEDYTAITELISLAKPTRQMSVQDSPGVSEYYSIEMKTESRMYFYFIYQKNGVAYIEMPYEGIYTAENTLLQHIKEYHKAE